MVWCSFGEDHAKNSNENNYVQTRLFCDCVMLFISLIDSQGIVVINVLVRKNRTKQKVQPRPNSQSAIRDVHRNIRRN